MSVRYVWLRPTTSMRLVWIPFLKRLSKALNLKPLLIVSSKADASYFEGQAQRHNIEIETFVMPSPYSGSFARAVDRSIVERAVEIENEYDVSLYRDVIQSDRHYGSGFIWGWNKRPRSTAAENVNHERALAAAVKMFGVVEQVWQQFPPGLIVGYGIGTGLSQKPLAVISRRRGVPFRNLASGRFGGLYYWSDNEFENTDKFQEIWDRTPDKVPPASEETLLSMVTPPVAFTSVYRSSNAFDLVKAIYQSARRLASRLLLKIRGHEKAAFGYKPLSYAAMPLLSWYHERLVNRRPFMAFDEIPTDRKWCLLPLQFEPESSLNGQSPEESLSLKLVYETALSLPADCLLLVKEHPLQLGRRPLWMYDLIAGLPNAVLVQPGIPSAALMDRTAMVVQTNSSLGYEAAVRGIPVTSYSIHGLMHALPHVRKYRSRQDLSWTADMIRRSDDADAQRQRQQDGLKYLFCLTEFCMDLPKTFAEYRREDPSDDELEILTTSLLESLESDLPSSNALSA